MYKHNKPRKRIWEEHTFGSSRCHEVLSDLVSREKRCVGRRVSRYLQKYQQGILDISTITREDTRKYLARLWKEEFDKVLISDSPIIQSHYQTCLSVSYKKIIRNEPINYVQRHPKRN